MADQTPQEFVAQRYAEGDLLGTGAYNEALAIINQMLVTLNNLSLDPKVLLPLVIPNPLDEPEHQVMLHIGESGLPLDVEQAIWNYGLEQSDQDLEEAITLASRQWAMKGHSCPNGALTRMIRNEINKFEDARRESNYKVSSQSYDTAAKFAREKVGNLLAWQLELLGYASAVDAAEAANRAKQAQASLRVYLEQMQARIKIMQFTTATASQLVGGALIGLTASASVSDAFSELTSVNSSTVIGTITSKIAETATINTNQSTTIEAERSTTTDITSSSYTEQAITDDGAGTVTTVTGREAGSTTETEHTEDTNTDSTIVKTEKDTQKTSTSGDSSSEGSST